MLCCIQHLCSMMCAPMRAVFTVIFVSLALGCVFMYYNVIFQTQCMWHTVSISFVAKLQTLMCL